jgi:hypothetical protein
MILHIEGHVDDPFDMSNNTITSVIRILIIDNRQIKMGICPLCSQDSSLDMIRCRYF